MDDNDWFEVLVEYHHDWMAHEPSAREGFDEWLKTTGREMALDVLFDLDDE